jgi:hypothetical protein
MVVTRSQRRAVQALSGHEPSSLAREDGAPAAYLPERVEEYGGSPPFQEKPLLRKTSSLQRITETVTLLRAESWRHLETQVELIASGAPLEGIQRT